MGVSGLKRLHLSHMQIIALSFAGMILIGSLLLSLPAAVRDGTQTPYIDALFTAASAACVTGLVVFDTFTHWSTFGQLVILTLIQIGGLGFMTIIMMFFLLTKKRISLGQRDLMRDAVNVLNLGGMVRMTRHILIGAVLFEGVGAILLAFRICPVRGLWEGIYESIFLSVSAFCNAGFDLNGWYGEFSSLEGWSGDWLLSVTVMGLIIIGGIGFFVWEDILKKGIHIKKYHLHTKMVLMMTLLLIFIPSLLLYSMEWNRAFSGMNWTEAGLAALFQAVSPRTAGFSTVSMTAMSNASTILILFLMLIGGSPGSTAGGMKTTTLAVLILSVLAVVKKRSSVQVFHRRLMDGVLRRACAIMILFLSLALGGSMLLSVLDPVTLREAVFETVSALGTVGLSMGITPNLSNGSKLLLCLLMYIGRIGSLTFLLAFTEHREIVPVQYPKERVMIG